MFFLLHLYDYLEMAKKLQIVIMVITLGIFLVPANVFAHVNFSHQSGKSCCSNSTESTSSECCKSHKDQDNKTKGCDVTCGNLSCHCPSTTIMSVNHPAISEETNTIVIFGFKSLWNYAKQQPKPIYFQIWSPPKLG